MNLVDQCHDMLPKVLSNVYLHLFFEEDVGQITKLAQL